MLLKDTLSYTIDINGAGTYFISNAPTTVSGVSFLQGNVSSNTSLFCGSNLIYKNFAKDTPYIDMNYQCNDILQIIKTGADEAMVVINYLPYNISTKSYDVRSEITNTIPITADFTLMIIAMGVLIFLYTIDLVIKLFKRNVL